jgi:hypothetical protein
LGEHRLRTKPRSDRELPVLDGFAQGIEYGLGSAYSDDALSCCPAV